MKRQSCQKEILISFLGFHEVSGQSGANLESYKKHIEDKDLEPLKGWG